MSPQRPFVDLVLTGDADLDDIDDFVAAWHGSGSAIPIHEFLGLTRDEYQLWVEREEVLSFILASRRFNCTLENALRFEGGTAVAARSTDVTEARAVLEWLQQTGRIAH